MERERDERGRFVRSDRIESADWRDAEADETPCRERRLVVQQARPGRPGGWTEAKRADFLEVLAATCNISAACRAVGMSPAGVYKLRDRDATFRRGWRGAIAQGYARLEVEMLERALIAEDRVRGALAAAESDREALELLAKHPSRGAELLYRVHRQTALEYDEVADDDPDGEKALALIKERVDRLRERLLSGEAWA